MSESMSIEEILDATHEAWRDLHEWRRLAERQYAEMGGANPLCPTLDGILKTKDLINRLGKANGELRRMLADRIKPLVRHD